MIVRDDDTEMPSNAFLRWTEEIGVGWRAAEPENPSAGAVRERRR